MTTRSGRTYKSATENPTMTEESVAALMRILLEDRKAREEQYEAQQAQMREKNGEATRKGRIGEEPDA